MAHPFILNGCGLTSFQVDEKIKKKGGKSSFIHGGNVKWYYAVKNSLVAPHIPSGYIPKGIESKHKQIFV